MQRRLDRFADRAKLALVDGRHGIHHDEECEQQRDEVRVGDEPAFVVLVLFVLLLDMARTSTVKRHPSIEQSGLSRLTHDE